MSLLRAATVPFAKCSVQVLVILASFIADVMTFTGKHIRKK